MLANGATLAYRVGSSGDYTLLPGLKELPDLGNNRVMVDNTTLDDSVTQQELGIGDPGTPTYKFKYDNKTNTSYRKLRSLEENGTVASFKETLFDGTTFTYDAQVAVKVLGAGVNGAVEFEAAMALHSSITPSDPSGTTGA